MTSVRIEKPTRVAVSEFRVRFTCLDQDNDQQRTEEICEGIADAHIVLAQVRAYQYRFELPRDAEIWWRPGAGAPWQKWGSAA